ncbi:nucleotide sugar dehydrogenase [Bacillus massiliglaciei]|uniref:nucleotide sugar dehydrogenase n=1 Tax=Bacillus massiliglaciei TaxID=1816693 RepID=UPI000DA63DAB|nr:nucleotide sugar dehydrogenase [Bacillus massiliglaciei]
MDENAFYKIAVIGLGYVGLPLSNMFLEKGHTVYGIDLDSTKVQSLLNGKSYLSDFSEEDIKKMFEKGNFHPGNSFDRVSEADAVIICVPTPLDENADPDLKYVKSAIKYCLPFLQKGQLIVLESSTYPGTTEEEIVPMIEDAGFAVGQDIFTAYSPERINPGDELAIRTIPKVVGGVTESCTKMAKSIYESIFDRVVVVSSPKVAELTKILENYQRFINISIMNELLMLCDEMDIDLWEVIDAAATKPYGFTSYYPGPGIGGHCIPVDPLYLLWKAGKYGIDLEFISHAHKINHQMPAFILHKLQKNLQKPLNEMNVLAIGATYKKDVNDLRESTAIMVMQELQKAGTSLDFHDPFISTIMLGKDSLSSVDLMKINLKEYDCVLLLTDHTNLVDVKSNFTLFAHFLFTLRLKICFSDFSYDDFPHLLYRE